MTDIFISYAREDRPRVELLAKVLEDQGWTVFWDRTIPAGKTWRQVIGDALETARSVIVAWSNSSVASSWVQEEADRGRDRNILIPILIDNVKPPLGFGAIQAADLISWESTQSSPEFEKLISDLSAILGPSPLKARESEQKRAEEEVRHKQDEEKDHNEEEQRKAVEERERNDAEANSNAEKEQKRRAVKEKIKPDKPETAKVRPPDPKHDAKSSTETRLSPPIPTKSRKSSTSLRLGTLAGVIVLLITGGWLYYKFEFSKIKVVEPISSQKTITNSIDMKLLLIQAGRFTKGMGSQISPEEVAKRYGGSAENYKDERPQHPVEITKPFYLQTTEVSQGQWKSVMGNNPSNFTGCGDECPVEAISWDDAIKFVEKLNQIENTNKYRLPTEAEWEYACRAGTKSIFPFGDDADKLDEYAWYYANSDGKTHPVGKKSPNAWGLYDMLGNVLEWCQDWYKSSYYSESPIADPKGPADGEERVLRGGSFNHSASETRPAHRRRGTPNKNYKSSGFRVARDL